MKFFRLLKIIGLILLTVFGGLISVIYHWPGDIYWSWREMKKTGGKPITLVK